MTLYSFFSILELIHALFEALYKNIFKSQTQSDIDDHNEEIIFNEIYRESIKKEDFENNNVNRSSIKLDKKMEDNDKIDCSNSNKIIESEIIAFDNIYENNVFWDNYFQSEQ